MKVKNIKSSSVVNVYGVYMTVDGTFRYLVTYGNHDYSPDWEQAKDFKIIDSKLPQSWHGLSYLSGNFLFTFGYKALLNDIHFDGIVEGNKEDLQIFKRNKLQIDLELILNSIQDMSINHRIDPNKLRELEDECLEIFKWNDINNEVIEGLSFINNLEERVKVLVYEINLVLIPVTKQNLA